MTEERSIAVGIGELLWDMLPGGKQIGGAPFNFARHCGQLGLEAFPISRVGIDELGKETLSLLDDWGVDASHVSRDPIHGTGTVQVTLNHEGKPSYEIREGVAWDFLSMSNDLKVLAPSVDAVAFGSLAQRNACSRSTIQSFLDRMRPDALKLFDVNLRQNYFTIEILEESLKRSNILKLSDEELPVLAKLFSLSGSIQDQLAGLMKLFNLKLIAYTRGPDGSLLMDNSGVNDHPGIPVAGIDTIGAGDSFSATLCVGLLKGLSLSQLNDNANKVATYVCSQSGATPDFPADLIQSLSI